MDGVRCIHRDGKVEGVDRLGVGAYFPFQVILVKALHIYTSISQSITTKFLLQGAFTPLLYCASTVQLLSPL